ncbi:MAG: hypothetical protein L3K06_08065, partial [Thermoplasmata archaeon]|nr:hypothetical protein [Thermoplasmata archaeon]
MIDAVAGEAIAYELHRWREAVRNDPAGELALDRVLDRAGIGAAAPARSVGDELDARLATLPAPPRTSASSRTALAAWAEKPDSLERAQRWARTQSEAGPNPAALYPEVLDRESEEGSSIAEAAMIVLADSVALAEGRPSVEWVDAARRLAAVQARYGQLRLEGEEPPADETVLADTPFAELMTTDGAS